MKRKTEGVQKLWEKYKYVALVVLIGVGMLLWPSGNGDGEIPLSEHQTPVAPRDMETEMETILGMMRGVGQVRVMLTVESEGEKELAQDTELSYRGDSVDPEDYSRRSKTVLVDGGSGDTAVVIRTMHPTYRGALVVCQGGGKADVKLTVTEAVAALTGISADRITVAEWQ